MIKRLQIKFVVIIMTIVTVMLCVILLLVNDLTRKNLERESLNMMRNFAAEPFQPGFPNEFPAEFGLPYFTLQQGNKGELIHSGGGYFAVSDEELLREIYEETLVGGKDNGVLDEHKLRFSRINTPRGAVFVYSDISGENTMLSNLMKTSILIGVSGFLVFLALSIILSRWAVKPVAEAWQRQKQFVADASHELKTPLTVIMTNAELIRSDDYSEEEKANFSGGILTMSRQMRSLLENMLDLARSDAGQAREPMHIFDFSELMVDAAISFEGVFADRGLQLESDIVSGIKLLGSENALRQVADILLDNAAKYSDCGGTTRISLRSTGQGRCRLTVASPGAEISREELKKIFLRFYRADKARSRDGSFGLGLSIAESIVSRHKGRIWAESSCGINSFIVELHSSR